MCVNVVELSCSLLDCYLKLNQYLFMLLTILALSILRTNTPKENNSNTARRRQHIFFKSLSN